MTFPSHPSSVPLFHSLESGTVEQNQELRNTQWNGGGTSPLKALATKVLERNKEGNKAGTVATKSVPLTPQCSTACGTGAETDNFLYEFNERVAIAEYDGEASPVQANSIAYLDAFLSILFDISELDPQKDWLAQRVQTALNKLETQKFHTMN
jgi:hypothetical protein